MKRFMSVVSADHFQHYISLYIMAIRTWSKDITVHIYVRGETDSITNRCMSVLTEYGILGNERLFVQTLENYPNHVSTTNCLRFLVTPDDGWHEMIITDIDLLLFADPFPWHRGLSETSGQPFAGHHGPLHKPHRPEICSAWQGSFERVAGGFFYVTPEWYEKTKEQRRYQEADLRDGRNGAYRESDEVMLARIIKGSGMRVPTSKHFPLELRGIHLGDFKESMRHRWTSMAKMYGKLTDDNCRAFVALEKQEAWKEMLDILREDSILTQILANIRTHINERGIALWV